MQMSTVTTSLPAEVKGEASAGPARDADRPDFVMLPIARQWGEHRHVTPAFKAFVGLFTGISAFAITALIR
jgi:hypothetical protein